jgi:two-component system, chemotaxis family, CheB/CheR fusion protein
MKHSALHILLVEDNLGDVRSVWNMLREKNAFDFTLEAVNGLAAAFDRLSEGDVDAILLDLSLITPLDETNAIESLVSAFPDLPILVLTVLQNEHEGMQALQAGAEDYLLKEEIGTRALVRALYYATERKKTEAKGRLIEQRLRLTIDSIADYAIITLDERGIITDWSVGAEHLFGYKEADAVGKEVALLFTPDDQQQGVPDQELQEAREMGAASDERWMVRQDGSLFFASGQIFPVREGSIHGFIKVCRDATPQKRIAEERDAFLEREQTAYKEAKSATIALEKSLALLAHELRTPLTSIKGFASTLLAEYPTFDSPTWYRFVQIIDEEANKLTELTNLLFDLVRMRAGVFPIQPERTYLEDIWAMVQAQVQSLTQKHRLVVDFQPGLPPLMADGRRITQVFSNLIGNATKFSPPETEIIVHARAIDEFIEIEVCDQGIGIPPEDHNRIFEAFQQVDNQFRRHGAGLGTTICKGIIEAHGGRIWIKEQPTPGTTIVFTLPTTE